MLAEAVSEATGTIRGEWGPRENPDERSFYACSPHRIKMAGQPGAPAAAGVDAVVHRAKRTQRRRRRPVPQSGPLRGFGAR